MSGVGVTVLMQTSRPSLNLRPKSWTHKLKASYDLSCIYVLYTYIYIYINTHTYPSLSLSMYIYAQISTCIYCVLYCFLTTSKGTVASASQTSLLRPRKWSGESLICAYPGFVRRSDWGVHAVFLIERTTGSLSNIPDQLRQSS